jgi:hypothetical protein
MLLRPLLRREIRRAPHAASQNRHPAHLPSQRVMAIVVKLASMVS